MIKVFNKMAKIILPPSHLRLRDLSLQNILRNEACKCFNFCAKIVGIKLQRYFFGKKKLCKIKTWFPRGKNKQQQKIKQQQNI